MKSNQSADNFFRIRRLLFSEDNGVNQSHQAKALLSPLKAKLTKTAKVLHDEFFGVYCLISRSSLRQYKNRCYIGFTVDPNRRIRQHNAGREKGGAKKTDNRGPDMVCIIHGFPNSVAALRFEWAWQNPDKSRVIKGLIPKKTRKETPFAYRLRIACHLMNTRPWNSFALTFRWLLPLEEQPFPDEVPLPPHVRKKYGLIEKSTCQVPLQKDDYVEKGNCHLCGEGIRTLSQLVRCPSVLCAAHYHARCLALDGLNGDRQQLLYPVKGYCPQCSRAYLWGDIIRDQRMIIRVDEAQSNDFLKGLVPRPLN
uniref:Structure-specific endonuclease subunit SLX1 homolog n=1 Tax=Angiostrongylus cantonensis TaxID=6313 RepID=A0A0K0DBD5_ANGCA